VSANIVRWCAGIAGVGLVGVVPYLCLWPVPAEPISWTAQTPPGYTGAHAPNTRLASLHRIDIGNEFGPEHIAIGPDGKLYAAMTSGNLLRMDLDGQNQKVFANTGGRVLGFDFDSQGRMIAADAMKGLIEIAAGGRTRLLSDRVGSHDPIRYANSIVVAPTGTAYFTDASTRFAPAEWGGTYQASLLDIIEQSASGRVLAYDPATASTRVVARGLSFANGIALSADGQALFVAETGRYRIWLSTPALDHKPVLRVPFARSQASPRASIASRVDADRAAPRRTASRNGRSRERYCFACPARSCRWANLTVTSSPSTRRAASRRICRIPQAPIPIRRARPRRQIAFTSTACTPTPSAGCHGKFKAKQQQSTHGGGMFFCLSHPRISPISRFWVAMISRARCWLCPSLPYLRTISAMSIAP